MRPYSEDLRERAVQRAEAGETIREIAAALRISPSCVSKWRKRQRETGSLAPDQVGGHKPRTLVGEPAEWLRARVAEGAFTTRGLTAELAARGIKTDRRAVWVFARIRSLHRAGFVPLAEAQAHIPGQPWHLADDIAALPLPADTFLFEVGTEAGELATRRIVYALRKAGPLGTTLAAVTFAAIDKRRWTMTVPFEFTNGGLLQPRGISAHDFDEPGTNALMGEIFSATIGLRAIVARHRALVSSKLN
jgi:putative transposase